MSSDRVAVYVAAEMSLPEVLRIAAGLGAHITSTDMSRTGTDRVVTVDADVAFLLADVDARLRFVPDITATTPEPEPVVASPPMTNKPIPADDATSTVLSPATPESSGGAASKPKKKTKAKKTTARRKPRGANGGES